MSLDELRARAREVWSEFQSRKPRVLLGAATCGRACGILDIDSAVRDRLAALGIDALIKHVGCLGLCCAEPLVEVTGEDGVRVLYGGLEPEEAASVVEAHLARGEKDRERAVAVVEGKCDGVPPLSKHPMMKGQVRVVLRNAGVIDPEDILHYIACGGYEGLEKALGMKPDEVVEAVKRSGLRGRGGAGFPTGLKWGFCRNSPGSEKYVVCNADEGDPGAFMDRSVLESDPHSVLEGLLITAYAIGAPHGYVYARAEYPLAIERLEKAIEQAREAGILGGKVLGSGFSFELRIKKGAGAFVCGEETALIASIEGKRGMPRPRPPFPAESGLFGKPTNINNVETLANVPEILRRGPDWFASLGTEKSPGTKTFALAGKVNRTGLIEVPMGIRLREIIFDIGGGIPSGKQFKAVQTGGPSGGCIPAHLLGIEVDYESLAREGSIMGSGGMIVMDEETCIVDVARYFLDFTAAESCGKCPPCRLGTRQMLNILTDICSGRGSEADINLLEEIAQSVKDSSLCGLGQTAPNPVLTTLRCFRDEYAAHIRDRRCPALVCRELIAYTIDAEACTGCHACFKACPAGAVSGEVKKPHEIDQEKCIHCGACFDACRFDAVKRE